MGGDLRRQLTLLLADRHSPQARAFLAAVARRVHERVAGAEPALRDMDPEQVVADVLLDLACGTLAAYRGDSVAGLLDVVESAVDRVTGGGVDGVAPPDMDAGQVLLLRHLEAARRLDSTPATKSTHVETIRRVRRVVASARSEGRAGRTPGTTPRRLVLGSG